MNYWDEIKQEINAYFPDNNNKEITAERLRTVMNDVVNNINIWYYGTEEINDQYYTNSYIDTHFYTKNDVDDIEATLVEDIGDANGRITDIEDNLSSDYYTKNDVDDICGGLESRIDEINMNYVTKSYVSSNYQEKLVSGQNIKTLSNESILGSGNISLPDVIIVEDGSEIYEAKVRKDSKEIIFVPNADGGETVDLTMKDGTVETTFLLATIDYKNVNIVVGDERKIGTWTEDGVTYDLYEKIVNVGNLPNSDMKQVDHGVTNKVKFVYTKGDAIGQNSLSIPFVNDNGSLYIYMGVGNTKITITTNSDRSNLNGYITLRYIRTRQ